MSLKRYLSHFAILPDGKWLKNNVVSVQDKRIVRTESYTCECAGTEFFSGLLVFVATDSPFCLQKVSQLWSEGQRDALEQYLKSITTPYVEWEVVDIQSFM